VSGGRPYTVALGDFDSDGVLDALTANWSVKDVSVLLGRSACLPSP